MDNNAALMEQVREIMATTFGVEESEMPTDVSQQNFARWTSLNHMTLVVALEERFGITLSMNEMTSMTTLPKILEVLTHHGATANQ